MTDDVPVKPTPVKAAASDVEVPLEGPHGVLAAPLIYADWLGARGNTGGVVNITLCAHKYMALDDSGYAGRAVVAHLRMPLHTAIFLKKAIEEIELALKEPASEAKN